jgi:NAD(P)H dehydrogenase (quinone)
MTNTRILVTGATGKIGGAVIDQLLAKGISTRALVHRDDARSARLRALTPRSPLRWPRGVRVWRR